MSFKRTGTTAATTCCFWFLCESGKINTIGVLAVVWGVNRNNKTSIYILTTKYLYD